MLLLHALPYIAGILVTVGAGVKWLYGQIKEDRNHYEKLYQQKETEVEELKDQVNKLKMEIVKLKASQKDAFFDGDKEVKMKSERLKKELTKLNARRTKLSKFLSKQNKKTLSATQRELLKEQKQAMTKYAKVLELRIKNLEAKNDD